MNEKGKLFYFIRLNALTSYNYKVDGEKDEDINKWDDDRRKTRECLICIVFLIGSEGNECINSTLI